jgi:hypothetical protein
MLVLLLSNAAALEFDGEILNRSKERIQCLAKTPFDARRDVRAEVYAKNRIVHLPGTNRSVISEWIKAGEILCRPGSGERFEAALVFENAPRMIKRGCRFIFLRNRAPVFSAVKSPRAKIPPGTREFIALDVYDPEDDGFFITWKSDKGRWLRERTRSCFNFFVAPEKPGTVTLDLSATDVFGARTGVENKVFVGETGAKDLYQFRHTVFDGDPGNGVFLDAKVDAEGNTLVLERDAVRIFSPRGILTNRISGVFSDGLCLETGRDGYLYVLDEKDKAVYKLNRDGKVLVTFHDRDDEDPLQIEEPVDFIVDENGTLFLLDRTLCRILVYNGDGHLVGAIGARGTADGQMVAPTALEMGPGPLLYVLDPGDLKIKLFDLSYRFVRSIRLSERFDYRDCCLDPFTETLYLAGVLKGRSSRYASYLSAFPLGGQESHVHPLEPLGATEIRRCSLDLEGRLLLTSERRSPVVRVDAEGKFQGHFLAENPSRSPLLCSGPLGAIYFESDRNVKRLNEFGWIDRVFFNNGVPAFITVDRDDRLYLLNKNAEKIKVHDASGRHVRDIALPVRSREKVLGIGVDAEDRVFILKSPFTLVTCSGAGRILDTRDLNALSVKGDDDAGKIAPPARFFAAPDGSISLIDRHKKFVYLYSPDFKNNLRLGPFKKVEDLSVDLYGNIYVLDTSRKSVFKFSPSGALKREINVQKQVRKPERITAFGDGEIMVFDDSTSKLYKYK